MSRRLLAAAIAIVIAAAVLVLVGRHERRADLQARNAELAQIAQLVDGHFATRLTGYRQTPWFGCFLYGIDPKKPFGVELCFDQYGRLIEAIDRRTSTVHIGTLRFDPAAATTRVNPSLLLTLLKQRAPRRFPTSLTTLPLGSDLGPLVLPARKAHGA